MNHLTNTLFFLSLFSTNIALAETNFDHYKPKNYSNTKWNNLVNILQETKILPEPNAVGGSYDYFGTNLDIEGNHAIIGAPNAIGTAGVAYIYDYDGTSWKESQLIKPIDGKTDDSFGISVSLSGNKVLIGASESKINMVKTGAAYIFTNNSGTWKQTAKLLANDGGAFDGFASTVSLQGDRALIGAKNESAYIFDGLSGNWQQTAKLSVDSMGNYIAFGSQVSLSGNRVLIGASGDDTNGSNSGSAYIFEYTVSGWIQTAKLTVNDIQPFDLFGSSVSLLGNTALVGAKGETRIGAAYIFEFISNNWVQTAKLSPDNGGLDSDFGSVVKLTENNALIGAHLYRENSITVGSAYLFTFSNGVWSQTNRLIANDGEDEDNFGVSIGISGDVIFVSSNHDDDIGTDSGSVYVFNKQSSIWSQSQKITEKEGANGNIFGDAISLDGERALIGAQGDNDLGANSGSAYVFDYTFGKWSKTVKLFANDGAAGDKFGNSVSLLGDRALIGASGVNNNGIGAGSVYVFDLANGNWKQSTKLYPSVGAAHDNFGGSVSLSDNRALIGATGSDDNGNNSGAAYVFDYFSGNWTQSAKLLVDDGNDGDFFGFSVCLDSNRALISSPFDGDNGESSGSAYIFDFIAGNWIQSTKLLANDGNTWDSFGVSVSLDNDLALIGANLDDDNGVDSGSAYLFKYFESNWLQAIKIKPSEGSAGDRFGSSVSIENKKLLIGANRDFNDNVSGSAYYFEYLENSVLQISKIIPIDGGSGDYFGNSVSLSGDRLLIGSVYDDDNGSYSGSAYIFNKDLIYTGGFE